MANQPSVREKKKKKGFVNADEERTYEEIHSNPVIYFVA